MEEEFDVCKNIYSEYEVLKTLREACEEWLPEAGYKKYDTLWTIRLILGILFAVVGSVACYFFSYPEKKYAIIGTSLIFFLAIFVFSTVDAAVFRECIYLTIHPKTQHMFAIDVLLLRQSKEVYFAARQIGTQKPVNGVVPFFIHTLKQTLPRMTFHDWKCVVTSMSHPSGSTILIRELDTKRIEKGEGIPSHPQSFRKNVYLGKLFNEELRLEKKVLTDTINGLMAETVQQENPKNK